MQIYSKDISFVDVAPSRQKLAGWLALMFLCLCVALIFVGQAGDVLHCGALMAGILAIGSCFSWIQLSAASGNKVGKYLDRWRRALAAEPLKDE